MILCSLLSGGRSIKFRLEAVTMKLKDWNRKFHDAFFAAQEAAEAAEKAGRAAREAAKQAEQQAAKVNSGGTQQTVRFGNAVFNQNAGVIYNNFSNISGNVVMNMDGDEILIDGQRLDHESMATPQTITPFEICRNAILKKGINVHIESDLNVVVRQVAGNQLVAVASGELFGTHHPQLAITRDGTGLLVTAKFVKPSGFVQDGRLEIRLPKGLMPEVCVETRNANITFSYVTLDKVQADSYNGNIVFAGSLGDRLTAATYNGDIDLRVVALDSIRVDGKSYNGDVFLILVTTLLIASCERYARKIGPVCALHTSTCLIRSASFSALVFSCFLITLF